MITILWKPKNGMSQEIPPKAQIEANGRLIINYKLGSSDMKGYEVMIKDPFQIIIAEYTLPSIEAHETFKIQFPLSTHLQDGTYVVSVIDNSDNQIVERSFSLKSRRNPKQIFLMEKRIKITNMKGQVESLTIPIKSIPESFLLQHAGRLIEGRGTTIENEKIIAKGLLQSNQKTLSWSQPVQPSYIAIDTHFVSSVPDDYYALNGKAEYSDEPGLEISHPLLDEYDGNTEIHFPIDVIREVSHYIHKNMRYVRQTKERGLIYALEHGRGDCTEYAAFAVSLFRKLGLKARLVSGMGRSLSNNWISHAFVEVLIYGAWVPLDIVKPPKPYLQLGNRGDLIGLSRKNWLDETNRDFEIRMQAYKGSNPTINYSQKVTETGFNSLSNEDKQSPRKTWFSRSEKARVELNDGSVRISKLPLGTKSVLLINGTVNRGTVIGMQPFFGGNVKFDMFNKNKEQLFVAFLDKNTKCLNYQNLVK